mmetsp:Transcript_46425/g.85019  ORF Transcript_46425/g.85019 Transcript_46425/m.85019 type:complete len:214 (+) Transcript_46425:105-746(+)
MGAKCGACFGKPNADNGLVEVASWQEQPKPLEAKPKPTDVFEDLDKAFADGVIFKVSVARSRTAKLGMSVLVLDAENLITKVEVQKVEDAGLISLWNREQQQDKLVQGHVILQINGRRLDGMHVEDFNEIFSHWRSLDLLVYRGLQASEPSAEVSVVAEAVPTTPAIEKQSAQASAKRVTPSTVTTTPSSDKLAANEGSDAALLTPPSYSSVS